MTTPKNEWQMTKAEFKEWMEEFCKSVPKNRVGKAHYYYSLAWRGGCSYTYVKLELELWKKHDYPNLLNYNDPRTCQVENELDDICREHWEEMGFNEDGEYVGIDSDI